MPNCDDTCTASSQYNTAHRNAWQMDEEARRHLQLTLEGKERPVPAFFTKYITSTYGKDSFAYCRAEENSKYLAGAELALIMGRMARRLSEEEALDYVAGIAIGQDFAERDWDTNELRWLYGKAYDAPIGLGTAAVLMAAPCCSFDGSSLTPLASRPLPPFPRLAPLSLTAMAVAL